MGRKRTSHCPLGHERTPENTYTHPNGRTRRCKLCRRRCGQKPEAKEYHQHYQRKHVEKLRASRRARYADPSSGRKQYNLEYNRNVRKAVLIALGGKCANPNCRWLNLDGTIGCNDERLLHIDHPNGGGNKERRDSGNNNYAFYSKILKNPFKYRLLCAQCNWLHRFEDF